MRRTLSVALLAAAAALAVPAPSPAAAARTAPAPRARIQWETGFASALKKAKASRRPVMVEFWADWCGWCHTFESTTFVDPTVVDLARSFVAVRVDTEGAPADVDVAVHYSVDSLPTLLFLTGEGRVVLRVSGYEGPEQFAETLGTARDQALRVAAWEQELAARPGDATILMKLGLQQLDNEAFEEARDLLGRAVAADGSLPLAERKRLRLALSVIRRAERKYAEAESLLKEGLALTPGDERIDPQLLFMLGRLYLAWGRKEDALGALKRLVSDFPKSASAVRARRTIEALTPTLPAGH